MNCLVLDDGHDAVVIDCGVSFLERDFGIDVVHPSFDALDDLGSRLRGVVVTHGHEDHIGALPYFLERFDLPVYAPRYALELIKVRAREHDVLNHARFFETAPRERFKLGALCIEPIAVDHSIADATALLIETQGGNVLHSGDFKFEGEGSVFEEDHLRDIAARGIDVLLSDSTNVDVAGSSASEADVAKGLAMQIAGAKGGVIVSLFASNGLRMKALGRIAKDQGRKIVLVGRSMETHARVARTMRLLDWPADLVWPKERMHELPRHAWLALATGSQGEPEAALSRIAESEHPALSVQPGDRVVLSSRVIPGHELEVASLVDKLLRAGADVRTATDHRGIHASGHACRDEQTRLIEMAAPKSFVPLHGTLRHLRRHGELATSLGVASVAVLENGRAGGFEHAAIKPLESFASGRVYRAFGDEVSFEMLRERKAIGRRGIMGVLLVMDRASGRLREAHVRTRGVHEEAPKAFVQDIAKHMQELLTGQTHRPSEQELRDLGRIAARRACMHHYGYKAEALVHVYLT